MILNCRGCGSSLRYDIASGKLLCEHCSSYYEVSEFDCEDTGDEIEVKTGICTACGGRLVLNDMDVASFCVFCGQPTIVPEQVSRMKKPKYIVPFSISREQACDIIKKRFRRGRYIKNELKNFEPEAVRGVYVPFMRYGVDYRDRQLIMRTCGSGTEKFYLYFYREAKSRFPNVTVDASIKFNDESSQRLEPYDLSKAEPFHVGYLSGYYAFCMNEDSAKMEETARARCEELFDEEILESVRGKEIEKLWCAPDVKIVSADYTMLPVWFVVLRAEGKPYTVMVNGQSGKIVGTVPFDEKKVAQRIGIYSVIFSIPLGLLIAAVIWYVDSPRLLFFLALGYAVLLESLHLRLKAKCMQYGLSRRLANAFSIRQIAGDERRD